MERNKYIDTLKFVLIFLVVFGHVLGPYIDDPINLTVRNLIYLFHMPLFIYISGYFSKTKDHAKFKKGILRLVETLVVFQLLYSLPKLIHLSFGWADLIKPNWILWYLLSLIFWKIIVFYIPKTVKPITVISVSILCSLLIGFLPVGYPLSLSRTFVFLPFFIIGYYSGISILDKIKKIPKAIPAIVLVVTIALLYFLGKDLTLITSGSRSYYLMSGNVGLSFLYRLLFLLSAVLLSISVINLVLTLNKVGELGRDTIFYYVEFAE